MKNKTLILLAFLALFTAVGIAQPTSWNWYFGTNCALNFSTGTPVSIAGSAISTWEGSASISDATGNLLFYTDGITIWDRNSNPMPGGNGTLLGNSSSTQSAVIVPKPNSTTLYYVFTADAQGATGGISYSIIDMTMNTGNGDVATLNTNLLAIGAEKITAIKHANGADYWIIVHELGDDAFYVYLLCSSGLQPPIVENIGIQYINNSMYWGESIGYLKASPNGAKLAAAIHNDIDTVQLFDFNNATGAITNPINIPYGTGDGPYGVSFSPNNTVLYIATETTGTIYQYDISSNNQATINASQYVVATSTADSYMALQLASNGKVYSTESSSSTLAVINFPNVLGAGCNFVTGAVSLGTGTCGLGLPNFVDAVNATANTVTSLPTDTTVCSGPVVLDAGAGATSYLWSTGATTETISVATQQTVSVIVTRVSVCATNTEYDTINIHIIPALVVNIGNDTTLCIGANLTLDAGNAGAGYHWSTGANTQTITVAATGNYSVTVTAGTCVDIDSILVTFVAGPNIALGADISVCAGTPVTLDAGNVGAAYLWSNGATTQTISPTASGIYYVAGSFGACVATDTILVTFITVPVVYLGPDQLLCNGQSAILDAGNAGSTYLWSTGAITQTINASATGLYSVQVQNGVCTGSDTVQVTSYTGPTVNLGPDIKICYGADTALDAGNAGMNYFWNNGSTEQNIRIYTSGTYWVDVDNHGCKGSDTAIVIIGKKYWFH